MTLWTDVIDPASLTGYARAALEDYEERKGTLARWLPNRDVADIAVRFVKGQTGLVDAARFRSYDAEPELGKKRQGTRVTLELPALGQTIPVSEYERLRAAGGVPSDEAILRMIQATTTQVVRSIADSLEMLRGIVLATGRATIAQDNFAMDDSFGRPATHDVIAPALWSVAGTDALTQFEGWADTYRESTGEDPGAFVMSNKAFRALSKLDQFQTQLLNGVSRPSTQHDVLAVLDAAGLPPIHRFDRRVSVNGVVQRVLPEDKVLLLPAPVSTDDWQGTDLGATFHGRTLSSLEADWAIEDSEQPGIVAGVYRHDKPPHGAEIIGDAIGMPVLANADRSFAATVL